eukprot:14075470-Alexandrium_andersonii.AAC.1
MAEKCQISPMAARRSAQAGRAVAALHHPHAPRRGVAEGAAGQPCAPRSSTPQSPPRPEPSFAPQRRAVNLLARDGVATTGGCR